MLIKELVEFLDGKLVCGDSDFEFTGELKACASDLMSDVLTLDDPKVILITGLNNLQVIRTAEMADIKTLVFVRNKKPTDEMLALAREEEMNLIISNKSMFHVCGLLYQAKFEPVY